MQKAWMKWRNACDTHCVDCLLRAFCQVYCDVSCDIPSFDTCLVYIGHCHDQIYSLPDWT